MGKHEETLGLIRDLMDLMVEKDFNHLKFEEEDGSITLTRQPAQASAAPVSVAAAVQTGETSSVSCSNLPAGDVICSPIVGTFYAAPSPDKEAFAPVGATVKEGDVVFIIESMKLMNEVQSDFAGHVAELYVKNGQAVEFGQPVMRIE